MTQVTSKKPAGIETQSSSTPEVIVNRDALIIGNEFYLIDDIKDVEIKYMPWQVWIGLAAFLLTVYLYYFHPNMLVVSGYTTKAYHVTGLVAVLLGAWGKTEPAQMVIGLSGKRVQVLERPEKELKDIRKKILEFKKAAAAPQGRTSV